MAVAALTVLVGCAASSPRADFVVTKKAVGPPIAGFGACMNPYVFAFPNMPPEINAAQAAELEARVKELHPQFVRIFFLNRWLDEDNDEPVNKKKGGMRESVIRTIRLAQDSGATVLLQLWYDPDAYKDVDGVTTKFARAIKELRGKYGLTSIQYATIQNEPDGNPDDVKFARYPVIYRSFDRALRAEGIRGDIQVVGGDLAGEKWQHWLEMIGHDISGVCDGYSVHAYWDYWRIKTFRTYIAEVKATLAKMPANAQRPMYITEFGARGFRERPGLEPGKSGDGKPICDVPVYSFEICIFMMESINAGFAGTIQWDMYDAWYDRKMGYGVIGPVERGFDRKPGYWLLKMFTEACAPGWRGMKIDGAVEDVWVSALRGRGEELSVFVLNRVHANKQVTIGGLKAGRLYKARMWNSDGNGLLEEMGSVRADDGGVVTMSVPDMGVEVLMAK
jgi:hypothetical protein